MSNAPVQSTGLFSIEDWVKTPKNVRSLVQSLLPVCKDLQAENQGLKAAAIEAACIAASRQRETRKAVFVADRPGMRENKLAFALKKESWSVVLLHRELPDFDTQENFTATHQYGNSWQALSLAAAYSPVAYHVFSNWYFDVSRTLVQYKPGTVIFDTYDLLNGMLKDEAAQRINDQVEDERYCLENADGLCLRGLHTQYIKRRMGFRLAKRLLFPDYCWNRCHSQRNKADGIHVVYTGGVEHNLQNPVSFHYELAVQLSNQYIHFHIYPRQEQASELRHLLSEYVVKHGKLEFVHIHDRVPSDRLVEELSQYHYGVIVSSKRDGLDINNEAYHPRMNDYVTANKIFDYIDAGLFVLSQDGRWIRRIIEQHGNGKVIRRLEDILGHCKHAEFSIPSVPRSITLSWNARRLTEFYQRIARKSGQKSMMVLLEAKLGQGRCFNS